MDPVRNPFAPGAGTPPPELAGRTAIIENGITILQRVAGGRPTRGMIMVGLRGVGKTVLLNRLYEEAVTIGSKAILIEAHEGKSLPELLIPSLRSLLFSLSTVASAKDKARRGLIALKGFLNGLKVTIKDIDIALSIDHEPGLADSGNLEADLPDLMLALAEAAKAADQSIVLFMDELQYLSEVEFSALIMAIHRINQRSLPLVLIGAGLPQILALAGNSKSYAERLFRYPPVGPLDEGDAIAAIVKPALSEGVTFEPAAIDRILDETERYPYFLQQWGYEAWNLAETETITAAMIEAASVAAVRELDQSFFKVRFDRCTPSERKYMRALAELGPGSHRSGDVAEMLGVKVTSVAPTRSSLIRKGMIYSPAHGETAFTVPLFDRYMRRTMPAMS